jgi:hypothetical protein
VYIVKIPMDLSCVIVGVVDPTKPSPLVSVAIFYLLLFKHITLTECSFFD